MGKIICDASQKNGGVRGKWDGNDTTQAVWCRSQWPFQLPQAWSSLMRSKKCFPPPAQSGSSEKEGLQWWLVESAFAELLCVGSEISVMQKTLLCELGTCRSTGVCCHCFSWLASSTGGLEAAWVLCRAVALCVWASHSKVCSWNTVCRYNYRYGKGVHLVQITNRMKGQLFWKIWTLVDASN